MTMASNTAAAHDTHGAHDEDDARHHVQRACGVIMWAAAQNLTGENQRVADEDGDI